MPLIVLFCDKCLESGVSVTKQCLKIILIDLRFNKPLQGMAPTECLPSACLLSFLLACLLICLPACSTSSPEQPLSIPLLSTPS